MVIPLGVTFDENLVPPDFEDPSTWFDYEVVGFAGGCREYPPGTGANPHATDIGAIILAEPVTDIQPAVLPPEGLLDALKKDHLLQAGPNGTRLTVVGYGWDLSFPPPEPVWPFEPVPVVYDGQIIPFMGGQRKTAQSGYLGLNDAWLHLNQSPAAGYGGTQVGRLRGSGVLYRSGWQRSPGRHYRLGPGGWRGIQLPHRYRGVAGVHSRCDRYPGLRKGLNRDSRPGAGEGGQNRICE